MAISTVAPVWYGQAAGTFVQGQIPSQGGVSGAQSKDLQGIATFILDGAATTATLNWIDGTQKPYQQTTNISAQSATAPATIGGVANQSVISGVGAFGQLRVGQSVTTTGFANSGNNGTFTVNAVSTSSIQVTNASAVAETNSVSANVAFNSGSQLALARGARAFASAANVTDTAATTITATLSAITQTSATVTFSAAGTAAQTASVFVELFPAS